MEQKYLTRKLAAEYIQSTLGLPITAKSMGSMAVRGNGPKYQKFGNRVVYSKEEIELWVQRKLSPVVLKSQELKGTK